jgi:hypothetical protein
MKTNLLLFIPAFLILASLSVSTHAQIADQFTGKWKWHCPTLDPQYADGYLIVKKDTIITVYNSINNKFPSDSLVVNHDTVYWNYKFFDQDVLGMVIFDDTKKIKGSGTSPIGTFAIDLEKEE